MAEATKAISTYGTKLMYKASAEAQYTQLCPIRTLPATGGDPERIDVTTFDDAVKAYILGIQDQELMKFEANYTLAKYTELKALENKDLELSIWLGSDGLGSEGKGNFTGQLSVYTDQAEVNGSVSMIICIAALTQIVFEAAA